VGSAGLGQLAQPPLDVPFVADDRDIGRRRGF
jgi:hypothetical protein